MPGYELINKKEKKALSKLFDDGAVLFAHGFVITHLFSVITDLLSVITVIALLCNVHGR